MKPDNLLGAGFEEMAGHLAALGEPSYRARQIFSGIYRRRLRSWDEFTVLGKSLRDRLSDRFFIGYPPERQVFQSEDGTRRYLFEFSPGQRIEAVLIPEARRDTICISTQVGCAVGCLFCVTATLPMRRNLSAGEIVGQVLALQGDRENPSRQLNVVIMGMGEPLRNYANVMKAIRIMTDARGMDITSRHITLSTSGIVPGIERMAAEPVIPNLAISLNATTDAVRDLLIPINRKWNLARLLEACRKFPLAQRRRITFEYVLIAGMNDTSEDARRLARLLEGLKNKVNLIPLNADPLLPLQSPTEERILAFQKLLTRHHVSARIRRARGQDISAACGLLAGRS